MVSHRRARANGEYARAELLVTTYTVAAKLVSHNELLLSVGEVQVR